MEPTGRTGNLRSENPGLRRGHGQRGLFRSGNEVPGVKESKTHFGTPDPYRRRVWVRPDTTTTKNLSRHRSRDRGGVRTVGSPNRRGGTTLVVRPSPGFGRGERLNVLDNRKGLGPSFPSHDSILRLLCRRKDRQSTHRTRSERGEDQSNRRPGLPVKTGLRTFLLGLLTILRQIVDIWHA